VQTSGESFGTNTVTSDIATSAVSAAAPVRATERGPGVSLPPTAVFVAGFALAWWLHQQTRLPMVLDDSLLLTMLGWALLGLGVALFLWALRVFFTARTGIMLQRPATSLLMVGPYAWSRNPQYFAFAVIYAGAAMLLNTLWPLVLLPSVLLLVAGAVIAREERYLRMTFGSSYDDYCRRVGRWF
jgi:protein-S-isoprenylcysteine O-methyltransferase Ste14